MARAPLFLERRGYRRRRMMDAVRLLPLLGLALWMVPLLWAVPEPDGQGATMPVASALRYVFGIWVLLVLCAWGLWARTADSPEQPDDTA